MQFWMFKKECADVNVQSKNVLFDNVRFRNVLNADKYMKVTNLQKRMCNFECSSRMWFEFSIRAGATRRMCNLTLYRCCQYKSFREFAGVNICKLRKSCAIREFGLPECLIWEYTSMECAVENFQFENMYICASRDS